MRDWGEVVVRSDRAYSPITSRLLTHGTYRETLEIRKYSCAEYCYLDEQIHGDFAQIENDLTKTPECSLHFGFKCGSFGELS